MLSPEVARWIELLSITMGSLEFTIPTKPEDLANEDCSFAVRATDVTDLAALSPESLKRFTQGIALFFYFNIFFWRSLRLCHAFCVSCLSLKAAKRQSANDVAKSYLHHADSLQAFYTICVMSQRWVLLKPICSTRFTPLSGTALVISWFNASFHNKIAFLNCPAWWPVTEAEETLAMWHDWRSEISSKNCDQDLDCSGLGYLDGMSKRRLIDSLCSNLSVLGVSLNSLVSGNEDEERDEAITSHCSALKAYTFLLWWIHSQAVQEATHTAPAIAAPRHGSCIDVTRKNSQCAFRQALHDMYYSILQSRPFPHLIYSRSG